MTFTIRLNPSTQADDAQDVQCDSRLFLLDLLDPLSEWRQATSFPGICAVGKTMTTVVMPNARGSKVGGGLGIFLLEAAQP